MFGLELSRSSTSLWSSEAVKRDEIVLDFDSDRPRAGPLPNEPLRLKGEIPQQHHDRLESCSNALDADNCIDDVEFPNALLICVSKDPRRKLSISAQLTRVSWITVIFERDSGIVIVRTINSPCSRDENGGSFEILQTPASRSEGNPYVHLKDDTGNLNNEKIIGDLFSSGDCLAQCLSAEFHMGQHCSGVQK